MQDLGQGHPPKTLCSIYRPLKIRFNYNPDFLTHLRDLFFSYRHKVIMGDLNADFEINSFFAGISHSLTENFSYMDVSH